MNTRCYRCGWSFSLSREVIENAVANAGNDNIHVEHCPRCRQVIKIPIQQLRRALPPGWTPANRAADEVTGPNMATMETPAAAAPESSTPAPEPEAGPTVAPGPAQARKRSRRTQASEPVDQLPAEEASPATKPKTPTRRLRKTGAATTPAAKTTKKPARKQTKP